MASKDEARERLYTKIYEAADAYTHPRDLLRLAEAFAWLTVPGQPHGGSANSE